MGGGSAEPVTPDALTAAAAGAAAGCTVGGALTSRHVGSFSFSRALLSPVAGSSTPTPALGAPATADRQLLLSTAAAAPAALRSDRSLHAGAGAAGTARQSHADDAFCSPGASETPVMYRCLTMRSCGSSRRNVQHA